MCQIKLSGKDYKPHTLQDALRAKAKTKTRSAPIASVTEARTDTTTSTVDLVAAVFPQSYTEKSILEGSDVSVSSVRAPPPLKGRHFIWTCQLTNATDRVSLKAKALIDGGAHMVLICPDVVE